jgi:elongation factor 3
MAPAATSAAPHTAKNVKAENSKAVKVLEELLGKLNISKAQDEINASALDIATFINGDIEEGDAPVKYATTSPLKYDRMLIISQGR